MKRVLSAIFLLSFGLVWANDAYVSTAGGNLLPVEGSKSKNIRMASEIIEITLMDDSYQVSVEFEFFNSGEAETVTVGFPQWREVQITNSDFSEFSVSLNGQATPYRTVEPAHPDKLSGNIFVTRWYLREINFPANRLTRTAVKYVAPYGVYGISKSADYLFGTGATWSSTIGKIDIRIINKSTKWINELAVDGFGTPRIERSGDASIVRLENVNPEIGAMIRLLVDPVPSPLVTIGRIDPDKRWFFRERVLSSTLLGLMTRQQLKIVRNLVYAGRGQIFESPDIKRWIDQYCSDWYRPTGIVTIDQLTEIELENIEAIRREESNRF